MQTDDSEVSINTRLQVWIYTPFILGGQMGHWEISIISTKLYWYSGRRKFCYPVEACRKYVVVLLHPDESQLVN